MRVSENKPGGRREPREDLWPEPPGVLCQPRSTQLFPSWASIHRPRQSACFQVGSLLDLDQPAPRVSGPAHRYLGENQELWLSPRVSALRKLRQDGFCGFKISTSYTMGSGRRLYKNIYVWAWWLTPSIPSTREVETGWLSDLKAVLGYIADSWPSRAM